MQIYNTLTAQKESFQPILGKKVGMYVCGPTVYDFAHLGHGRSAVSFDVIRRYLIYKGFDVTHVSNYTDIDDHMITRAGLMKITVKELSERIIPEYAKDYSALGIMVPDVQPKATEYVSQMIDLIKKLHKKGMAYVLDDGVYFDISKFPSYGKLSKQNLNALQSGARVDVKESKRNPQDFVLWKFSKPGEPEWDSPWGKGRPGWHIECSAMSKEYLGDTFDIHGGGADLTFPHHECEIAQSECANNKPFARYWLHNGFVQINNEKMSKSLGNFFLLRDVFAKYPPQAVRYLFLQTHYRSPIEFTNEILAQAKNSLMRLHDFMTRLKNYISPLPDKKQKDFEDVVLSTQKKFEDAMNNDFETAQALAAVFDLVKDVNKRIDAQSITLDSKERAMSFLMKIDAVFGVFVPTQSGNIDDEIMTLIQQREIARKNKDWKESDRIRDELLKREIQLEDTPQGTVWKRV